MDWWVNTVGTSFYNFYFLLWENVQQSTVHMTADSTFSLTLSHSYTVAYGGPLWVREIETRLRNPCHANGGTVNHLQVTVPWIPSRIDSCLSTITVLCIAQCDGSSCCYGILFTILWFKLMAQRNGHESQDCWKRWPLQSLPLNRQSIMVRLTVRFKPCKNVGLNLYDSPPSTFYGFILLEGAGDGGDVVMNHQS